MSDNEDYIKNNLFSFINPYSLGYSGLPSGMNRMMGQKNELRLKQKAKFYFTEKLICHVIKEPKGFVNGWFRSDLINDLYYMFEDQRWMGEERKLFLCDIFDISDYEVRK